MGKSSDLGRGESFKYGSAARSRWSQAWQRFGGGEVHWPRRFLSDVTDKGHPQSCRSSSYAVNATASAESAGDQAAAGSAPSSTDGATPHARAVRSLRTSSG